MCKMTDCDFALDFYIGKERSLVVDFEGEYAMLIRGFEGGAENGAVWCVQDGLEIEAMKR